MIYVLFAGWLLLFVVGGVKSGAVLLGDGWELFGRSVGLKEEKETNGEKKKRSSTFEYSHIHKPKRTQTDQEQLSCDTLRNTISFEDTLPP
jgi:hypothetical protein